jgi:hypothetical protein
VAESDQPSEIVIQLGSGTDPSHVIDPSLRDLVEVGVRRAYPRTTVKVFLSGSLESDLVHVDGGDAGVHADAVRRFIEQARKRARRSGG